MTVIECVGSATTRLMTYGLPRSEAKFDAEVLARYVLGWNRTEYLTHRTRVASPTFIENFEIFLNRRSRREPVSQILGYREFWGLRFRVSKAVLTPRPETEFLVEEVIKIAGELNAADLTIFEIGTGSGCVSIALATELPQARIIATDISEDALVMAHKNSSAHNTEEKISWLRTSYLEKVEGRADFIVSNPPYIPESVTAELLPEVKNHEPKIALFGGKDGLEFIRKLLDLSSYRLTKGGHLLFEFGQGQEAAIKNIVAKYSQLSILKIRKDYQDIPRVAIVKRVR